MIILLFLSALKSSFREVRRLTNEKQAKELYECVIILLGHFNTTIRR